LIFLDRTAATPSIPIFTGFDISLFLPWSHRSKSPSLAFDPLINNSSPVLRAVTPREELDTRLLGTRMLGLPMGFGIGQFLSCQNQYLDEKEGGSVKKGCSGLAVAGNKRATQPLCHPSPLLGWGREWKETGKNWWVGIRAA